jgi:hypothetical protein
MMGNGIGGNPSMTVADYCKVSSGVRCYGGDREFTGGKGASHLLRVYKAVIVISIARRIGSLTWGNLFAFPSAKLIAKFYIVCVVVSCGAVIRQSESGASC